MLECPDQGAQTRPDGAWSYLWLLVCPFAVLALLAASNAPGFIWREEGFGYDVLEYHLQLPKEYLQTGRIEYLPHNVYANFPANVEMLYLLGMIVSADVSDVGVTANMIHLIFAVLTVYAAWVGGREWSRPAGMVCGVVVATTGWIAYLCGLAYVENGMLFFGMVATVLLLRGTVSAYGTDVYSSVTDPSPCGTDFPVGQKNIRESDGESGYGGKPLTGPGHWRTVTSAGVLAGFACGCKYTALPLITAPLIVVTLLQGVSPARRRIADGLLFTVATLVTFGPWLIKNQVMTGNPVFPLLNSVIKASPPGWAEEETEAWDRGHRTPIDRRTIRARIGGAWNHLLSDRYQRFGPAIFVIGLAGLLWRRRDRVDLVLTVFLIVQLGGWLFATHLFARFAVVLLIPLALLCGRAVIGSESSSRRLIIAAGLVAGYGWNLVFATKLHRDESPGGAPASIIYDGKLAGFEYFHTVNHELPADAKVLLVGEARVFYFRREVDYCVTFNRNPFLSAIRASDNSRDIIDWLRERRYTHVLVNWSEVKRLASTYGFSPPLTPKQLEATFDDLHASGMSLLRAFPHPRTGARYVDLYEVPQ